MHLETKYLQLLLLAGDVHNYEAGDVLVHLIQKDFLFNFKTKLLGLEGRILCEKKVCVYRSVYTAFRFRLTRAFFRHLLPPGVVFKAVGCEHSCRAQRDVPRV